MVVHTSPSAFELSEVLVSCGELSDSYSVENVLWKTTEMKKIKHS